MGDDKDLSGFWIGAYHYPIAAKPVAFNAVIEDDMGLFTGEICENVTFCRPSEMLLFASIFGNLNHHHVHFEKVYESGAAAGYGKVLYTGDLAADGNSIQGRWTIPGDWSGRFVMERTKGAVSDLAVGRQEHELLKLKL